MSHPAVLYARISVSYEESVSVARQLESGRKYAEARGWEVVGVFVDDGVSATLKRPETRTGWRSLLASTTWFDAVIIWKVDRLARRVTDFLQADATLQARGAALVCVEQGIDMMTGEGRAFAQMLAVFGELEAAAISCRAKAARDHLIHIGRAVGGSPPYGYRNVPNPNGPGLVVAHHPERIEWVRGMVSRVLRGDSVNSIARWLDAEHAPLPRPMPDIRASGHWHYDTVRMLLMNPLLAGMITYNPGGRAKGETSHILRDLAGAPVIREELTIITPGERAKILELLQDRSQRTAPGRAFTLASTSMLFWHLVWCGECDRGLPMSWASCRKRPRLVCPRCRHQVSASTFAPYVVRRLLDDRGSLPMYQRSLIVPGDPVASRRLVALEQELGDAGCALTHDGADLFALGSLIAKLKQERTVARSVAGAMPVEVLVNLGMTLEEVWSRCSTDVQRREILDGQVERLAVKRGHPGGRYLDKSRVTLIWRTDPRCVVPNGIDRNVPARPIEYPEWISIREAARIAGCGVGPMRVAVETGSVEQRHLHRNHPSLSSASVLRYAAGRAG